MLETFLNAVVLLVIIGVLAWIATQNDDKWRIP